MARAQSTQPPLAQSTPRSPLARAVDRWLADGRAQGHSPRTLGNRKHLMEKFCWWLIHEAEIEPQLAALTPARIREFLTYLRDERPEGRFGSANANARGPARPSTVHTYYRCLRAFANFCLAEGDLDTSPLKNVKAPRVPNDQVQPFTDEQVQLLLDAARRSASPERDLAGVLLLLDTGLRAEEFCSLNVADFDKESSALWVVGKGNKRRRVYLGVAGRRAVWRYVDAKRRETKPDAPLFVAAGGGAAGGRLTPNGLFRLIQRTGRHAGLTGVRCSPHTLRHTFAINFLRGGGNLFELQQLMGHTDLTVLRRYVTLAAADLEMAHRKASPADRMGVK